MLQIKAYINGREIDDIRILNKDVTNDKGEYLYQIKSPLGFENYKIWFDRRNPWHFLMEKVLKVLNENGYNQHDSEYRKQIYKFILDQEAT